MKPGRSMLVLAAALLLPGVDTFAGKDDQK